MKGISMWTAARGAIWLIMAIVIFCMAFTMHSTQAQHSMFYSAGVFVFLAFAAWTNLFKRLPKPVLFLLVLGYFFTRHMWH